ncbi:Transmembrane protein EpsG [Firmicutes bacterium ASF500]|nr:Transmembrane protein EpsG [Firmicutes bacterium ASF500]
MLPYYFLIGTSLAGAPLLSRRPGARWAYLLVMGLACWLIASLRYVTGFDYRFYESAFQTISASGLGGASWSEPGYLLLNLAVSSLHGDFRTFLLVFHLLLTALVFVWIDRYSQAPWLSVFLFLTLQHFALSMNFLRQAMAAAIVLWVYPFLTSRRILPSCGVILLAMCFHRTALIMLPLCFLLIQPPTKRHYILALLAAGAAYLLIDPLIDIALSVLPKYQHYLTEKYWQGNSFLYILMPLGCFIFALPLIRQTDREKLSPVLANSVFYTLLLQLFITRHFILERLSIYVSMFSLLALPAAVLAPCKQLSSKVRTGILIVGALAYFLFAAHQGFHGVYPYHGIWDRATTP